MTSLFRASSPAGFADLPEDVAPGFAGVAVFFKFRERLPFGGRGCAAVEEVGFVEFGEPGE